jgi:tRNA modification GTPase
MKEWNDTIAAIATAAGVGAIGIIRLSGPQAITITDRLFTGKRLADQATHTLHFGKFNDGKGTLIDEVVVSLFHGPKSYTGEHVVEISGHGSPYVLQCILQACIEAGARMALPGEFTQRAFLHGKMDLAQAEAVADLIAADSRAAQQTALQQMRGGFSNDLKKLREELIHFAALIELELDFAEEDVSFADRDQLSRLVHTIGMATQQLLDSFRLGNAIKNGISVAIVGPPNAGKSTLLNALLNEERAIVSDIAGTTRDTIEETLNIKGILFRLVDTAGIRMHTEDRIEQIGVGRSLARMQSADLVVYLFDVGNADTKALQEQKTVFEKGNRPYLFVANKMDMPAAAAARAGLESLLPGVFYISARSPEDVERLKQLLYERVIREEVSPDQSIVTNARHQAALQQVANSLEDIGTGLEQQRSGDLLAIDIRRCLHYLGEITGQVDVDRDILGTIFGKFCIGK